MENASKYVFLEHEKIVGRKYTVEEVIEKVLQDEVFYKYSGGGVTLSSGDPVAHTLNLLANCYCS